MKRSAGTLLYRMAAGGLEVLLVHPAGSYNRRAPWSIPKGLPDETEAPEQAARRETREETGIEPGPLFLLGSIHYRKSRKEVICFAGPAPAEAAPHPASWEVDRAEFVELDQARRLLHPDQVALLDRLQEHLDQAG